MTQATDKEEAHGLRKQTENELSPKSGPTYSAFLYIPPTFLSKDQTEEHQTILSPGNIHLRVLHLGYHSPTGNPPSIHYSVPHIGNKLVKGP